MSSKTPLFDAALDLQLAVLRPGSRVCPETGETYELLARDIEYYQKLRLPPSRIVPWARIRRLRAIIGGYDLFKRKLADGREVITMYDPESPATILPTPEWMTKRSEDAFLSHGQTYDFTQSFFAQWEAFSPSVPRPAIVQDSKNESSEWSSFCLDCKSNYQCYSNSGSRDLFYCDYCGGSSYSADVFAGDNQEWCYEGMRIDQCSHVFFSEWCVGCVQSAFLLNCRNCHDCFGCANLVNKSFCFLNEQLTEEEYKKRLATIDLGDSTIVESWRTRVTAEIWNKAYRGAVMNREVENCEGDDDIQCKDVVGVGLLQAERVLYSWGAMILKDCMSVASCNTTEWSAMSTDTTNGYGYRMSAACDGCVDVEYSELLFSCEHCFGCIGLQKKQYCIFNTQYTEDEYYKMIDQIKRKMLTEGEYGEFFPYRAFLTAYNTAHADVMYPLTQEEATRLGARWYVMPTNDIPNARPMSELPTRLTDTTDEIVKQGFLCPVTGRPFRIVAPELDLHRKLNIALPRLHPTLRRKLLMRKHRKLQLYSGHCLICGTSYQTRIAPTENLPIICEGCYQKVLIGEHPALLP